MSIHSNITMDFKLNEKYTGKTSPFCLLFQFPIFSRSAIIFHISICIFFTMALLLLSLVPLSHYYHRHPLHIFPANNHRRRIIGVYESMKKGSWNCVNVNLLPHTSITAPQTLTLSISLLSFPFFFTRKRKKCIIRKI